MQAPVLIYQSRVIKQTSVRQLLIHRPEHGMENGVDLDRGSRHIAPNKNEKGDYQWPQQSAFSSSLR
jgi:hypothetical protein